MINNCRIDDIIYIICIHLNTYAYWCLTRFPYHMMFVSFSSNSTGATSGLVHSTCLVGFVYLNLLFPM